MALGLYFTPTTPMTAQKYDDCINRLKKAGAAHPAGRLYHAAFESSDGLTVFDVWTSQAAFDAFGQTLMPIMQEIGGSPDARFWVDNAGEAIHIRIPTGTAASVKSYRSLCRLG